MGGTSREQSTVDRLTDIIAQLLKNEVRRDEHAQTMHNIWSEFRRLNSPIFKGGIDPITIVTNHRKNDRSSQSTRRRKSRLCLLYATRSGRILMGFYQTMP